MSTLLKSRLKRQLVTSVAIAVLVLVAIALFHRPLVVWFTGKELGGAGGSAVTAHAGPFEIKAALAPDPPRQKEQGLILEVRDASGQPVDGAKVDVVYDMPAMGAMAEMKGGAKVASKGRGKYEATFDLPMGATWSLRAKIEAPQGSASQGFSMTVGSPGLALAGGGGVSASAAPGSSAKAQPPGEIDHYTCSMHPSVKQPGPGTCPICGMNLEPVTQEQQEQGVVTIDEAKRQLIGVRTEPVVKAPMHDVFRAVGRVTYDESTLADVNLKVRGWITKLYVNETGQRVTRGQTLFTMYSPELYNAEQDFLLATQGGAAGASSHGEGPSRTELFGRASRQRLHLLGLTDSQIDTIAKNGKPSEDLAIPSPASGFVIEKNVVEGASVDAGMRLYRIAALNKVWVEAEVYEADLAHVRVGQQASVTLDYLPGRVYQAKVAYVYPYLDPATRTGRVRLEIANKELDLRPGMYASVELSSDLGARVQVPVAAVVYTGPRRLVFVDLEGGRFRPQEVQVGIESNGMYDVLSGLAPGDLVATSGVFLIAAEARITTAAKYWDSEIETSDAGASLGAAPMPDMAMPNPGSAALPRPAPGATRPSPAHPSSAPAPAPSVSSSPPPPSASPPPAVDYTCPMHPEVHSATPGKCPICGMDLQPRRTP
jgi:Cu(I)/Ag(I) efflux system membrane fusion protein